MKTKRKEGLLHVQDADIYYRIVGEGPPIVLLHGNGEDHKIFAAQMQAFRKDYQLILIDSRGHGNSSMGFRNLDFKIMAQDVWEVLHELEIERAVILGFSDGANLGIQLAISYPKLVRALIAVSGNIHPNGMKGFFYWGVCFHYFLYCILEKFYWKMHHKKQLFGLMALHPNFTKEELAEITIPTLVMAGDQDIVRHEHTLEMVKSIPGAKLSIIKNAKHSSIYQKPGPYNRIIERFLKELPTE